MKRRHRVRAGNDNGLIPAFIWFLGDRRRNLAHIADADSALGRFNDEQVRMVPVQIFQAARAGSAARSVLTEHVQQKFIDLLLRRFRRRSRDQVSSCDVSCFQRIFQYLIHCKSRFP